MELLNKNNGYLKRFGLQGRRGYHNGKGYGSIINDRQDEGCDEELPLMAPSLKPPTTTTAAPTLFPAPLTAWPSLRLSSLAPQANPSTLPPSTPAPVFDPTSSPTGPTITSARGPVVRSAPPSGQNGFRSQTQGKRIPISFAFWTFDRKNASRLMLFPIFLM